MPFPFHQFLQNFSDFGQQSVVQDLVYEGVRTPVYVNEFWTSKQRAASPLHEVSYRACYKPQLPRFFINELTKKGDVIYDPFMGRGTTLLEAALLGRIPVGCDVNPLSRVLLEPRLTPPTAEEVEKRLSEIPAEPTSADAFTDVSEEDLLVFFHPNTLTQLMALREYFSQRELDYIDAWIQMVATNRLTGHSAGFFSVYTLPPNQAVTAKSQRRINEKRQQTPPHREVKALILKKTKSLLRGLSPDDHRNLAQAFAKSHILTGSADHTPEIADESVSLIVTSPPFLDVIDYKVDNWLRCWFNGIDVKNVSIWQLKKPEDWVAKMSQVFVSLSRVLKKDGFIAFEVGEVKSGKIKMEDLVIPAAVSAGLAPELIVINDQKFTKTANVWGVDNQSKGTNTNRIVLLRKNNSSSTSQTELNFGR